MRVASETIGKMISTLAGGISSLRGFGFSTVDSGSHTFIHSSYYKNLLRRGLLGSILEGVWLIRFGISFLRGFQVALRMPVQGTLVEPPAPEIWNL